MVEEVGKSDDHRTKNANKHSGVRSDSEEEERPKEAVENVVSRDIQRHPLEHSWTFWFDNPSAKSKQVAWGSSIRPIYTFSSIEEFWRSGGMSKTNLNCSARREQSRSKLGSVYHFTFAPVNELMRNENFPHQQDMEAYHLLLFRLSSSKS
nr:eukaryotic translation initiation factor 4E-1-like [Tanacetum cinerariifolium]